MGMISYTIERMKELTDEYGRDTAAILVGESLHVIACLLEELLEEVKLLNTTPDELKARQAKEEAQRLAGMYGGADQGTDRTYLTDLSGPPELPGPADKPKGKRKPKAAGEGS